MAINLKNINPEKKLFHNEWATVYPVEVKFEEIRFWPENYRTLLDFDILVAQKNKKISDLSLEEITEFLIHRYDLHLPELAKSIENNGVRVPVILLDDGIVLRSRRYTLLDGNRRYFACSHVYFDSKRKGIPAPDVLSKIPAYIIKSKGINDIDRLKRKILAEANFVPDLKVEWTLDVKAKVISEYFDSCLEKGLSEEKLYEEIHNVYSVDKSEVEAYVETIRLTKEFIGSTDAHNRNKFRELVQNKFVYFWEFRNKGLKGRASLDVKDELPKVKKLFFKMIETQRFKNMKQIEPMIKSVRDPDLWALLSESQGSKIEVVEAMYREAKIIKSAEDKIRNFLKWIRTNLDSITFTSATFKLLDQLVVEITNLLKRQDKL